MRGYKILRTAHTFAAPSGMVIFWRPPLYRSNNSRLQVDATIASTS
jgi:hypothetical protein